MTYRHEWASEVDEIVDEYCGDERTAEMEREIDRLIQRVADDRFDVGKDIGQEDGYESGYNDAHRELIPQYDEVEMLRTFAARILAGETVADVLAWMPVRDIVALRGQEAIGQLGWMVAA